MSDTVEVIFMARMYCKRCARELIPSHGYEPKQETQFFFHPQNMIGTTYYGHGPCELEAKTIEVKLLTAHGTVVP